MIHAELGASSSDRWMNCPGSVLLSREFPNVDTEFTREGTCAHEVAERCLKQNVEPEVFLGVSFEGIEVTEEMCEAVSVYLKTVRATAGLPGAVLFIEQTFDLSSLNPPAPMFGTSDAVIVEGDTLHVDDYKHGKGYAVPAIGNPQLRYYALGALLSIPPELAAKVRRVRMTIVQPRAPHPDGIIRSDECTVGELMDFSHELLAQADLAVSASPPLAAGGWCRFCRAQAVCPEQKRKAVEIAQVEFTELEAGVNEPPAPETMPIETVVEIMEKLPVLESWIKAMRTFVQTRLEEGKPVPGYKLVEKRATRKWFSEDQVVKWAKEQEGYSDSEIFDQKLKSPAQMEKLVGKGNLPDELVSKESSGYNVAPDYDNRPAVNVTRGEEFAALPPGDSPSTKAATKRSKTK